MSGGRGLDTTDRVHALDAVRAFALLLGIVLHATLSFVPGIAQAGWPLADNSPSATLGATFFVIHIFRMTLFFAIAGFFARVLFHRGGARQFWKDRSKRILVPLVLAWPVVTSLVFAAMYWAALNTGKPLVIPGPPADTVAPFPWEHLWFLYVLWWFYVLFLAARALILAVPWASGVLTRMADAGITWITSLPLGAAVLAIPVGLVLYWRDPWFSWNGIPTPDDSLLINLPALVGFGVAFSFGWLLQRQPRALDALGRRWGLNAVVAAGLTILAMRIAGVELSADAFSLSGAERVTYVVAYCSASWFWTFAIIGGAVRHLSRASPLRRYLADASYWMYLMHLPVVFGLQATMLRWGLHWSVKFAVILGVTLPVMLLSYHYLVRSTPIGLLLNGRRHLRMRMADAWRGIGKAATVTE